MRGHPIHDHADSLLVEVIDQVTEIVRFTVACGRRVVVSDLIAPRWSIGMFFEWQKLHVGEAHLLDVVGERLRHFTIRKRTILFFDLSPPRAEVNFVDRKRVAKVFFTRALFQPLRIAKFVLRGIDDRRSVGRDFRVLRVWVGFEKGSGARVYLKFVEVSRGEFGDEEFPDAGVSQPLHLVSASVPTVEVTDNADTRRLWRPNSERDAFLSAHRRNVRAEFFVDFFVAPFAEEMKIDVAKCWFHS